MAAVARRRRAWPRLVVATDELRAVAPDDPPLDLLEEVRAGWGDPDSAPAGLLLAALRRLRDSAHDGLECGSGVSTIVLGIYSEALGRRWWALEQHPSWARRVRDAAHELNLAAATVLDAPLRGYDGFEWYCLPEVLPRQIDFVLCDGPPANGHEIRLARYGLVPVLGERFADEVTILLDDADRPGEQEVLQMWESAGLRWTPGEAARRFAIVTRTPI